MDITLVGLLAFLILAALWRPAQMDDETWVSNGSSQTVVFTLWFNDPRGFPAETSVVNRVVVPGDTQGGSMSPDEWGLLIDIWVEGNCCHPPRQNLDNDESVVALDSGDGGVDVFQAVYGTLFHPEGNSLVRVYPQGYPQPDLNTSSCNPQMICSP